MDRKLFCHAIAKFWSGLLLFGLLTFLPAGTLAFPNGWLLMGLLFVPMFLGGLVLLRRSPRLLEKRLGIRETQSEQRRVVLFSGLLFSGCFLLAGLNHRFQWLPLPRWVVWTASAAFLLGYLLYARVLLENPFLSRTVEVQEHQRVIDTGLYGAVRHPMYSATLLLFLSMPLVLGSLPSFLLMLLYLPVIQKRMDNEEAVLAEGLEGYRAYLNKVKYRVIPLIW